jgi:hypothetical protein
LNIINEIKKIIMKKLFNYSIAIGLSIFCYSCQSKTNKMEETIALGMLMQEAKEEGTPNDLRKLIPQQTSKLSIQTSTFTNPITPPVSEEELILKNKVKTKKVYYASSSIHLFFYDKKGYIIKEEAHDGDSITVKNYNYEFGENDKLLKETAIYENGKIDYIREYEYNEDGKQVMYTFTSESGEISVTKSYYDTELNTMMEQDKYGLEKEFYDNRGLRVKADSYDEKGKLMGVVESQYNKEGLKTSESTSVMGMEMKDVFEYNDMGQIVKLYRKGLVDVSWSYTYNKQGLVTRFVSAKGARKDTTHYEYTYY